MSKTVQWIINKYKGAPMWAKILMISSLIGISIILYACSDFWESYPQDNAIEELVEDMIQQETGLDLDLSPTTPENK